MLKSLPAVNGNRKGRRDLPGVKALRYERVQHIWESDKNAEGVAAALRLGWSHSIVQAAQAR